jgi:hypothetical protein
MKGTTAKHTQPPLNAEQVKQGLHVLLCGKNLDSMAILLLKVRDLIYVINWSLFPDSWTKHNRNMIHTQNFL